MYLWKCVRRCVSRVALQADLGAIGEKSRAWDGVVDGVGSRRRRSYGLYNVITGLVCGVCMDESGVSGDGDAEWRCMMQQHVKRFLSAIRPVQEDGWLSLNGVYYPCGFYNHYEAAMEIAGLDSSDLEERGWVHISDSRIWLRRGLTQAQMDTLFDMSMLNPESVLGMNIASCLERQE